MESVSMVVKTAIARGGCLLQVIIHETIPKVETLIENQVPQVSNDYHFATSKRTSLPG